jgi:hypothetical protein
MNWPPMAWGSAAPGCHFKRRLNGDSRAHKGVLDQSLIYILATDMHSGCEASRTTFNRFVCQRFRSDASKANHK